jgi:hypothetical protein
MWGDYLSTSVHKQLIALTSHTNYGSVTYSIYGEHVISVLLSAI